MRKTIFLLLLATAATPALAANGANGREPQRFAAHDDRADRGDRAAARKEQSADRPQRAERDAPPPVQLRNVDGNGNGNGNGNGGPARPRLQVQDQRPPIELQRPVAREQALLEDRRHGQVDRRQDGRNSGGDRMEPTARQQRQAADSVRDWHRGDGDQVRVHDGRPGRVVRPPTGARPDRPAPAPRVTPNNVFRNTRWHDDWRRDHRYDWRQYRDRNRWAFNLGFYNDPFGWGYHRYGIGWRMYPSYYGSSYWLNDPWQYRLPPAYGPYRWVRYWDDALLVNIYTGEVADVIHDFFW
jgi:hypothetical protein